MSHVPRNGAFMGMWKKTSGEEKSHDGLLLMTVSVRLGGERET
jgi:hypothetical protein